MNKKERSNFTGTLGFVMAAAGSAVGLGNTDCRLWLQMESEAYHGFYRRTAERTGAFPGRK